MSADRVDDATHEDFHDARKIESAVTIILGLYVSIAREPSHRNFG